MNISDIRIKLIQTQGNLKAVASITIDQCFVVHDVKLIQGKNSLFIAMPGSKCANGLYKDVAHPLDTETREIINAAVIEAYEKAKTVTV